MCIEYIHTVKGIFAVNFNSEISNRVHGTKQANVGHTGVCRPDGLHMRRDVRLCVESSSQCLKIADTSNSLALQHCWLGSLALIRLFFPIARVTHMNPRGPITLRARHDRWGLALWRTADRSHRRTPTRFPQKENVRHSTHWLAHWLIKFQGHWFNWASLICIGNYFPLC